MFLTTPIEIPAIQVYLDVITGDTPDLLGLDVIYREELLTDAVFNRLSNCSVVGRNDCQNLDLDECILPIHHAESGHRYFSMAADHLNIFSRSHLHRLHRQFFHTSLKKLFNVLKTSRPRDATPETLQIFKDILKRCDTCKRIRLGLTRFIVYSALKTVNSTR